MIIILEGADNSGKSTLAKKLSEMFGLEVIHPGGPPKNIGEAIARCDEQHLVMQFSMQLDVIYDRVTCISDMIYRGKSQYHEAFDYFQHLLTVQKNVLLIYCRPSDERLKNFDDHVTQDHEDESVVDFAKANVDRIIGEYDFVMSRLVDNKHMDIIDYDFESENAYLVFEEITNKIRNGLDVK